MMASKNIKYVGRSPVACWSQLLPAHDSQLSTFTFISYCSITNYHIHNTCVLQSSESRNFAQCGWVLYSGSLKAKTKLSVGWVLIRRPWRKMHFQPHFIVGRIQFLAEFSCRNEVPIFLLAVGQGHSKQLKIRCIPSHTAPSSNR